MVLRLTPRTRQLGLHLQSNTAAFVETIRSVLRHRSDGTTRSVRSAGCRIGLPGRLTDEEWSMDVMVWLGLGLLFLVVVALVMLAVRRKRRAGGVIATKAKR